MGMGLRCRASAALVLFVGLLFSLCAAEAGAQNNLPRFCYRSVCHSTLGAAEAAMRAHVGVLGQYLGQETTGISSGNSSGVIANLTYVVRNQAPIHWNPPVHAIG
ncbi:MAG: hypothetical protein RR778_15235 [Glutamicibacter sp.]|uniref:hypothetical protein n=1 Tax=Glutamicibacter sp. TaxID=1931995 RepID=UPI002FCB25F7